MELKGAWTHSHTHTHTVTQIVRYQINKNRQKQRASERHQVAAPSMYLCVSSACLYVCVFVCVYILAASVCMRTRLVIKSPVADSFHIRGQ